MSALRSPHRSPCKRYSNCQPDSAGTSATRYLRMPEQNASRGSRVCSVSHQIRFRKPFYLQPPQRFHDDPVHMRKRSFHCGFIREFTVLLHDLCIYRKIMELFSLSSSRRSCCPLFEFRCDDRLPSPYPRQRHQCRRNVYILERSGHTVLSADRRQTKSDLCIICAEKRCKRLTPSLRIFCHTTEIFLEM